MVGGKDLSARVFSLNPIEGYRPPTLAGHREPIVAGALQHRFVRVLGAAAQGSLSDVGLDKCAAAQQHRCRIPACS